MKIIKNLTFAVLAALTVALLFQIPMTRAVAQAKTSQSDKHKLRLRVYFERFTYPAVPAFGAQFTIAGTVARFESPDERIGSLGLHFVMTAPDGTETMLYGILNLPEGQISFMGFSQGNQRLPGPITGGTGAYWNARGQLDHRSRSGGVEEFILTFVGN
jgi:hypothetical protein